ncbi:MAG: hypothetical protein JNL60_00960 [Bacteroidia bacterium]|nr:hypothetical protein [Bacteroidia bacterium]
MNNQIRDIRDPKEWKTNDEEIHAGSEAHHHDESEGSEFLDEELRMREELFEDREDESLI